MSSEIKVKILDNQDKQVWDYFVKSSPVGNIYHLWDWGELQKTMGYKPLRLGVIEDGKLVLACQVLLLKQGFLGTFCYSVYGPIFQDLKNIDQRFAYLRKFFTAQTKIYDLSGFELKPLFNCRKTPTEINQLSSVLDQKTSIVSELQTDYLNIVAQKQHFKISGADSSSASFVDLKQETTQLLNSQSKNTRRVLKAKANEENKSNYFEFSINDNAKYQTFLNLIKPLVSKKELLLLAGLPKFFPEDIVVTYTGKTSKLEDADFFVLFYKNLKLTTILNFFEISELKTEQKIKFFWQLFLKLKKSSESVFFEEKLTAFISPYFNLQIIFKDTLVLQLNPLKYSFLESGKLLTSENLLDFSKFNFSSLKTIEFSKYLDIVKNKTQDIYVFINTRLVNISVYLKNLYLKRSVLLKYLKDNLPFKTIQSNTEIEKNTELVLKPNLVSVKTKKIAKKS